jgi:hypothetical protein
MTESEGSKPVKNPSAGFDGGSRMETRYWRVGTFSMGLLLIFLGVIMLAGKSSEAHTFTYFLRYWPFILIVLGAEMILYNTLATAKGLKVRFSYDIFSIFLVLVLVFSSSAFLVFETTGIYELARTNFLSSRQVVEEVKTLYPIDQTLQELVLNVEGRKVNLRSYDGDEVKVSILYYGQFISLEEAEAFAADQYVRVERLNDSLFIDIPRAAAGRFHPGAIHQEIVVSIPDRLNVEVARCTGDLLIRLPRLRSDWYINHPRGSVDIGLQEPGDTRLQVEIREGGDIEGNDSWDSVLENEAGRITEAAKTWGSGAYALVIRQVEGSPIIRIPE